MIWVLRQELDPKRAQELCGIIPGFIDWDDSRSARIQLETNYGFPVYWASSEEPTNQWVALDNKDMSYPGDPPLEWIAITFLRDEMVMIYRLGYVAVFQQDESFIIGRMD